jgi:uncharacterized membrane protein YdjX (TVP38/TMEM64 family)
MKKVVSILISSILVFIAIAKKSYLLEFVQSESLLAIPISISFVALLVFIPVVPYVVLAGIIGSVFGILLGTVISLMGVGLGTITMFKLARYGFQGWTQSYLKRYPKIKEYETMFEQNVFIGILLARVIPIIPSPIINIIAGLSKVKWSVFLSASLIGKLPAIFLFTLAGSLINNQKWISIVIYGIYFLTIAILAGKKIQQKKLAERTI